MKNIIYVSNSILPDTSANSVHVMKMCNGFAENSGNVELLAKTKLKKIDHTELFNNYAVPSSFGIKLFCITSIPFHSVLISLIGFTYYILINLKKYHLIYSRNRHTSFILAILGVKQKYELHGISGLYLQRKIDQFICRSSSVTQIVAISKVLKDDLIDLLEIPERKILVAHDGADVLDIEKIKSARLDGAKQYNIGYVGSLLPGKGVDLICEVATQLPDIGFHIVGGSGELLLSYIENHKNINNLNFYGHVNQKKVQQFIKAFDAVVLPNSKRVITANGEDIGRYTSPLKLFEYLSFNKKILISRIQSFYEVVNEKQVIYFEPDNVDDLIRAINKLIKFNTYFNGCDLVKKRFSWRERAKKVYIS